MRTRHLLAVFFLLAGAARAQDLNAISAVEVKDDGAGLKREKIMGKARERVCDEYEHAKEYARTQKEALKEGFQEGKEAYKRAAGKGETA